MPISLASSFTITVSAGDYNGVVDGLGSLVKSHWIMPASGLTVTDRKVPPVQNGTLSGLVQYLPVPIAQGDPTGLSLGVSDGARMNVPANAAYNATAGGVGGLFQFDRIDATQQVLFARAGNLAGGMSIDINGGALRAFRFDGSGVQRTVTALALPSVGDAHAIFATWGTAGLQLFVDGVLQETVGITDWAVNGTIASTALSFMAWPTDTVGLDGCAGHLLFLGGAQPTPAQIAALSQPENICWAVDYNAGTVPESTTLSIDIRTGGSHFKAPIVPQIMAQGTRGTASVVGELLSYAAGAVTGDQADSFNYRVTSANGKVSTTETVSLTVTEGATSLTQIGNWPLSETGTAAATDVFDDTHANNNNATLLVPSWTVPTHVKNRRGIVAGSDHALEISNGGPAIPMIAAYKQAAMSLVLYFEPMGELRGTQYWVESDEKYGREFLAFCDDGVTPGSFAIYRKRPAGEIASSTGTPSRSWRLGGYVRTSAGDAGKQHFGGSFAGVSGTSLPPPSPWVTANTTARRVVLTMGPAGAALWLDNTSVSTMPTVTVGWSGLLTAPIHIGCSSSTGHANDRSPFWGRVDQIEVWQGQMVLADVQARPAAAQSVMWRDPTTAGTRYNIAAYPNLQAALDACSADGRWLWQDPTDATEYLMPIDTRGEFKIGCPGIVGLRLKQRPELTLGELMMELNSVNSSWRPPVGAFGPDGYRFIGCTFDGNIRARSWSAYKGHPGVDYNGLETDNESSAIRFGFQQNHCFLLRAEAGTANAFSVFADCCSFRDAIGDAFSITNQVTLRAESCRFYGTYRGTFVMNNNDRVNLTAKRCETFMESRLEDTPWWNGNGLTDIEPYTSASSGIDRIRSQMYDVWAEGEMDDVGMKNVAGADAWMRYYNTHTLNSGFQHSPRTDPDWSPPDFYEWFYGTISYYKVAGTGTNIDGSTHSTSFPKEQFQGCPENGWMLNNMVFIINGRETTMHDSGNTRPETSPSAPGEIARLHVRRYLSTTRVVSLINCQVQTLRLHPSQLRANKRFLEFTDSMAGKELYIDGLTIGASVATAAISMSGGTVVHRNVSHGAGGTISQIVTGASTYTAI